MVGHWPGMPGVQVRVLLGTTLFVFIKFTLRKYLFIFIIISELRTLDLDDCRQSSMHVHEHCLRNEQCTCMCDLKQDGCQMACLIRSWTRQLKLLDKS